MSTFLAMDDSNLKNPQPDNQGLKLEGLAGQLEWPRLSFLASITIGK